MTPINILIYEPYPMGQGGGNLRTLSYILKLLDRSRFNPVILAPEDSEFLNRCRQRGVEVVIATPPALVHRYAGRVLKDTLLGRVRSAVDVIRYNRQLARFMKERQVDVVYCNGIRALLLVGFGAHLAGVPVLWYVKGTLENGVLDRLGLCLADRIVFFCETNRDDRYPLLVRLFRAKIGIVRIGLDAAVIAEVEAADATALRNELDVRPDRINAAVVGQLYRPKGQHLLIEAMREIVDAHPNFMLHVVGDHVLPEYQPYRAELERRIQNDGLTSHVRFVGWRTDALQIVRLMDMVIHPSLAEGFGRAVLEAMALGRPVVASAVGGLREIIRDGENGLLVSPGDVRAIADRVKRLAADPDMRKRFGAEARREVEAHYLIEDKVRQLETVWWDMAHE